MDFDLHPDEALFQTTVRDFAASVLAPGAAAADAAGQLAPAALRELAGVGLLGMMVPEEFGGAGLDTLRYVLALEAIAAAHPAAAAVLNAHNALVCLPLALARTASALRAAWLPRLASGEVLGAGCPTGAGAPGPPVVSPVRATAMGDEWRLDGTARWVLNGGAAGLYLVWAATNAADGTSGLLGVAVEATAPGVSVSAPVATLGLGAAPVADLALAGCAVGVHAVVAAGEEAGLVAAEVYGLAAIGTAAQALGIGRAALTAAVRYARERRQFGRPIVAFEGLRGMLADAYRALEAARLLVYRAAWLRDRGQTFLNAAALARLQATEAAMLATTKAVQTHGGYGYMAETAVQRYFCDAKVTQAVLGAPLDDRLRAVDGWLDA